MNLTDTLKKLTLQDWVFMVFSVLWVSFVMLDYFNKQFIYLPSITHFKYTNLFIFLSVLGILLSAYYNRLWFFKKWPTLPINGALIFFLFMIVVWSVTMAYNKYWKAPLDYTNYMHLLGKGVYTLGCAYFMTVAAYSSGNLLRQKLISNQKNNPFILLDISLGFMLYTALLMVLGVLGVLDQLVLIGFIVLFILINYRASFDFVMNTLWKPIKKPNDLNFWGALIMFFILVYISMNYMYTQAPYPLGFDARNYYVNISKLIAEAGALVPGFQPYAWGLVMATGYIAFGSPEITMFLSALGGILSLIAIYEFCKRYVNLSSNNAALVALLYLLTPTVTNQFIIEFKIDLTLVFFQFVIINFLLWWLFEYKKNKEENTQILNNNIDRNALLIVGLLLGYCLSIKVLSVFLIFAVFAGLWWYTKDVVGVIGICALTIGVVLLAQLDNISGLRVYHLSPDITSYILLLGGLTCMGFSFVKNKKIFINNVKALFLCGIIATMVFSPWVYKNYQFTKSTELTKLIMGDKPRPQLTPATMAKNYREFQKKNQE